MVQRVVGRRARPGFTLPRAALRRMPGWAAAFACVASAPAAAFAQEAADPQLLEPIAVDGRERGRDCRAAKRTPSRCSS
ncbi:hypothetical protein [Burkholderia ubonensis]|uniref:hypothetical protein n=1 Tax=Burkholderia ubonensis TaxID=101571 RepID=UPI002AAF1F87|nr:hypothetical protein [Burkholderia ubonensis]